VYKIDGHLCRHLDLILEADFLGRGQNLTLGQAEARLMAAIVKREGGMRGENVLSSAHHDPQWERQHWRETGYRSVAYDAAGLTTTMLREFPDSGYKIIGAHMALMRSMIVNVPVPDIEPLWQTLRELSAEACEN
jgi:hypothetical protein